MTVPPDDPDLLFTIRYGLTHSTFWPKKAKMSELEIEGLVRDLAKHIIRSNYKIVKGEPAKGTRG
jgi:hypothetical protein